jgi:hypothetical protein
MSATALFMDRLSRLITFVHARANDRRNDFMINYNGIEPGWSDSQSIALTIELTLTGRSSEELKIELRIPKLQSIAHISPSIKN